VASGGSGFAASASTSGGPSTAGGPGQGAPGAAAGPAATTPAQLATGLRYLRDASEVIWTHCDQRRLLDGVTALAGARCVGEGLRGVGLAQHWVTGSSAQRAMHRSVRDHLGTVSHFPAHMQRACVATLGNPEASRAVRSLTPPPPLLPCPPPTPTTLLTPSRVRGGDIPVCPLCRHGSAMTAPIAPLPQTRWVSSLPHPQAQAIAEATATLCLLTGTPVLDCLRTFLDSRGRAIEAHLTTPTSGSGVLPALTHALTLLQESLAQACGVFLGAGDPAPPGPAPTAAGATAAGATTAAAAAAAVPELWTLLDDVPSRVGRGVAVALGGTLPPYLPAAADRVRWGRLVTQALGCKDSWLYVSHVPGRVV
jgi:hypothetical protein